MNLFISATAFSGVQVLFSERELDAAFTLMRPELIQVDITGRSGTVVPAPGLKYLGMNTVHFDMNLNFIANIVDLKFSHVRNKPFQVQFQDRGFQISVPVEDQDKAIQSTLGSISFKGVTLLGIIDVITNQRGEQKFALKDVVVSGQFKGTGLLKGKLVLDKLKQLLAKTLTDQLNRLLDSDKTQETLFSGLLSWSRFYTGDELSSLVEGSVRVDRSGIHFVAQ